MKKLKLIELLAMTTKKEKKCLLQLNIKMKFMNGMKI